MLSSSQTVTTHVSTTLTDEGATWNNSTVIRDDVAAQISRLKSKPGGPDGVVILTYRPAR